MTVQHLPANESWSQGPMLGYDCETTGPNPLTDRIVTSAIVLDVPGQEQRHWRWLVNPGIPIQLEATAVHGISDEHAQAHGQDEAGAVRQTLEAFLEIYREHGPIPLICVNAIFDLTILDRAVMRHGIAESLPLPFPVIDTLVCDRKLDMYRSGRRTLTAACAAYGIVIRGAHTAYGDVIASLRLARALGRKYPKFGRADLGRLQALQREAADERAVSFEKYRRSDGIEPNFTVPRGWPILEDESEQAAISA